MPSSIQKLQKYLVLEADRGFDNRAIVGGLEKILPIWQNEARAEGYTEETIQQISTILFQYHQIAQEYRQGSITRLTAILQNLPVQQENTPPQPDQESPPRPQVNGIAPENQTLQPSRAPRPLPPQPSAPRNEAGSTAIGLNAPLTVLSGVGPKHAQTLNLLGLNTLGDLLYYFPRRYDDYSQLKPINRLKYGDELTVIATIQSIQNRPVHAGRQITEAVISDETGFLRLTWFNQPFLVNRLHPGIQIVISGKIDMYLGRLVMNSPEWEFIEQEHLHTNRIVPVYPLVANITQKWLRKLMFQTVAYWSGKVTEYLPDSVIDAANLVSLQTALLQNHFPDSTEALRAARDRLAFDEIFLMQIGLLRQKRSWQSAAAQVFEVSDPWLEQQTARLPFPLTNAQQRVLAEIRSDLKSSHPINRLIQGDVGSGKTIVAALAASVVTQNNAQAALMAPTSILAEQHFRTLSNLLTTFAPDTAPILQPEEICLLIGDTPEAEKRQIREGLENGTIKLVIGTHALIEDPVQFKRLQMVIIDEQHRFGVAQRAALRDKGENPHLLVMTATPIPRSLALTVYGDLDLSIIDEMPPGRQPVDTSVLTSVERERGYQFIRGQINSGRQAFIICPLVDNDENGSAKAAVQEHQRLQKEVYPKYKLGLLHGRMKPEDKDKTMALFRDGHYQILVSTSVVEVGVDIPNATVMFIEGANRFGLSQLHQFRGRVGRGQEQSYCLLVPDTDDNVEDQRLAIMSQTNDGFVLAEHDLRQRGPGDFLGTRQSGFSELKVASLTDIRLIERARKQAQILFDNDPDLSKPQHQALGQMVDRFWNSGGGDVS